MELDKRFLNRAAGAKSIRLASLPLRDELDLAADDDKVRNAFVSAAPDCSCPSGLLRLLAILEFCFLALAAAFCSL